jgi:hypothetical protein
VPVDAATAAVNVTATPVATVVTFEPFSVTVSAVLDTVVPVELFGAFQKSPQPARNGVAASVISIRIIPAFMDLSFIGSPFSQCRKHK